MATARENARNLYMVGIRDGRPRDAVANYTGARYTQHSTGVKDGQAGFVEFFEPFIERNPVRDITVVRALQDGNNVFVHAAQSLNDGEARWVTMDFFDSDDAGRIIEHWDVIEEVKPANVSGRTMTDGPTEILDLDRTAGNKARVLEFIQTCLVGCDMDSLGNYIRADYLQHNAELGDGLAAFRDWYMSPECARTYQACFMAVAEGNFVATLNRARRDETDLCQCDLFRLEDGMIVEHWDASEPVPPRETWANSGKF